MPKEPRPESRVRGVLAALRAPLVAYVVCLVVFGAAMGDPYR